MDDKSPGTKKLPQPTEENREDKRKKLAEANPKAAGSTPVSKSNTDSVFHTLQFVEDVSQHLQVEIARREIQLRDILSWKTGAIIEFPKIIGEPMELLIGEHLIARGEVVVVNDRYGIRISEITRPDEKPGELKR